MKTREMKYSQSVSEILSTSFSTTTSIRKWGNSDGIRIPKTCMDVLELKSNDEVEIRIAGNSIIIEKIPKKKYKNLRERLEDYYQCPLEQIKIKSTEEVDWGAPEGEEIW